MKVFLINLDQSTDRLTKCSERLNAENVEFEKISAVYGASLSNTELLKHYAPILNEQQYYKDLTPGEIGCYLSHRKAWQKIVDENIPYCVILEDDFLISGNVKSVFNFIHTLEENWDYIKLAGYYKRKVKVADSISMGEFDLVKYAKIPAGTCAQAISLQGAKNLLKHSNQFGRPVDVDLQYWWEKQVHIFGVNPFPFEADEDELSIISQISNRKKVNKRRLRRIYQQVDFKIKNFFATKTNLF